MLSFRVVLRPSNDRYFNFGLAKKYFVSICSGKKSLELIVPWIWFSVWPIYNVIKRGKWLVMIWKILYVILQSRKSIISIKSWDNKCLDMDWLVINVHERK